MFRLIDFDELHAGARSGGSGLPLHHRAFLTGATTARPDNFNLGRPANGLPRAVFVSLRHDTRFRGLKLAPCPRYHVLAHYVGGCPQGATQKTRRDRTSDPAFFIC